MKRKKKNVWVVPIILVLVITGIIGYFVVQKGGIGFLFGQISHCSVTPNEKNCICYEGENKIKVDMRNKWICEPQNLAFDPVSPMYSDQLIIKAKEVLRENYPECDMIECSNSGIETEWKATGYGFQDFQRRIASAQCRSKDGYHLFSDVNLDLVTGAVIGTPYCTSYASEVIAPNESLPALTITPGLGKGNGPNSIFWTTWMPLGCEDNNGKGSFTVFAPAGKEISEWFLGNNYGPIYQDAGGIWRIRSIEAPNEVTLSWSVGTCRFVDKTSTYATVSCDLSNSCGSSTGSTLLAVAGYFKEYAKCTVNQTEYPVGHVVACGSYPFICQPDGTWLRGADGYFSTERACPETYKSMCARGDDWALEWYNPGQMVQGYTCQPDGTWN